MTRSILRRRSVVIVLCLTTVLLYRNVRAVHDDDSLVVGINGFLFWSELGIDFDHMELDREGVCFSSESISENVDYRQAVLAVYTTEKEAVESFHLSAALISVCPIDQLLDLGDEALIWIAPDSSDGTLLLRYANVVVEFTWSGALSQAMEFARTAVQLIDKGHPSITKGVFSSAPRIAHALFPDDLSPSDSVTVQAKSVGLDGQQLMQLLWAPGFELVRDDSTTVLVAPNLPGQYGIEVIVANQRCVITRSQLIINVGK